MINNKRVQRYISEKFIELTHENLANYKVIVPASNGSGAIGEVLSTPLIGEPLIGYSQTFIGVGSFKNKKEAENSLKYIKSKFARALLGILKVTQGNKKETWQYVPWQNFSDISDINWNNSVEDIDKQLYKKYELNDDEIAFINKNVKAMN